MSKQEIKGYVHKLGNLTLLSKILNSKAQNDVLSRKINDLKKSELPITKELVKKLENLNLLWNEEQIILRQSELAKLAFEKIWSL